MRQHVLLHELTDEVSDNAWVELPDGTGMRVGQYRAQRRVAMNRAAHAMAEAREKRRRERYEHEALF